MNKKIFFQFSFAFFLAFLITSPSIYAISMGTVDLGKIFGDNEHDYIVKNFLPYFGYNVNAYDESDYSLPLRAVMTPFLLSMMAVSLILLGYNAFVGTINTAQEGKVLGGKWSTVFTPIRTAIGFTMLLPIVSGFSIIQNIIVWFASQSIWVSDFMLARFIDANAQNLVGQVLVNRNTRIQLLEDMNETIKMKVCQNYFQYLTDDESLRRNLVSNDFAEIKVGNNKNFENATAYGDVKRTYHLGYQPLSSNSTIISGDNMNSVCGVVTIVNNAAAKKSASWEIHHNEKPVENGRLKGETEDSAFFTGSASMVDSDLYRKVMEAQFKVAQKYMVEKGGVSDKIAIELLKAVAAINKETSPARKDELTKRYTEYLAGLLHEQSYNYLTDLKNIVDGSQLGSIIDADKLKKAGVAGAGAWFFAINLQADQISNIVNAPPKIDKSYFSAPNVAAIQKTKGDFANHYTEVNLLLERVNAYLRNNYVDYSGYGLNSQLKGRVVASSNELGIGYQTNNANNNTMNAFNRLYSNTLGGQQSLSDFLTSATNNPLTPNDFNSMNTENPLIFTHVFGMKLLTWAASLMEKAPYEMSAMIIPIAITLLSISIMLAYYVPLMPFIVWVSAIIGWLGLLCEAMVGVVLWAVSHIIPDKDSFVGRQGQGYMLMLSLLTRLPMLVIGFVFANSLMTPIGRYVNEFFGFSAKTLISGSGLTWTLSVMAMCLIFAFVMVSLVKNIISLMYKISDNSLMWIGGPTTGAMGQMVQGIEGQAQSGFQQGMGSVSAAGNSLGMIVRTQNSSLGHMINAGQGAKTIDEAIAKTEGKGGRGGPIASSGLNGLSETNSRNPNVGGSSGNFDAAFTPAANNNYAAVKRNGELNEGMGKLNADLNSSDPNVRGSAMESLRSGEYSYQDSRGNTRTLDLNGYRMSVPNQELKPSHINEANSILNSQESSVGGYLNSRGVSNEQQARLQAMSISRQLEGLSNTRVR